ncbi:LysM peptidoglycan-binding domain-containing protein [Jannaschia formosa]|uniref:LysM peptidoglycan-binding domain-containing protein n=1 Tax=Jannaschia formosa TaxID=2259592 RepID=UPI000E1BC3F7|nr:LysM peptidoglycan-binding domain-containing protein [Jannaschia formosa]TFL16292.1 LysM peptidoglycan-binding domain-containing protein [Jannaschia formosa]
MNVSAVFGGVVASALVVGLIVYGALTRDAELIAVSTSKDELATGGPAATDAAVAVTRSDPVAPETPVMPAEPTIRPPEMGVVRVDAQGSALVAGTGPASADVVLRLDGSVIASARTDASGSFVSLFDLPASAEPQVLTLEATTADGVVTRAVETVIVAPTFPGQSGPGRAPVADRSTPRPSAGQEVAGQVAPGVDSIPTLDPAGSDHVARAAPADLTAPGGDASLADRTRPAAPVSAAAALAPVGEAPVPGAAPDPVLPEAEQLARATPDDLPAPGADAALTDPSRPAPPVAAGALRPEPGEAPVPGPAPAPPTPAADQLARAAPSSLTPPDPTAPPDRARVPETAASVAPVVPVQPGTAPAISADGSAPLQAPSAPRLIRAGPDGLSVETPSPADQPQVTQDLGIDVISYDTVGEVQIAGRAKLRSELRIYLNNQPVQTVRVGPDGQWNAPLSNVASGVYTLRVDEVGADGSVTARVETPFQRTAPEIAAQARRDGATAITVQPGYTLWALSEGYFGEGIQYVQLFEANRDQIRDPDLIYPGQVFRLPGAE